MTRVDFYPGWILWPPDVKEIEDARSSDNTLGLFGKGASGSQEQLSCDWTQILHVRARQVQDVSNGQNIILMWSEDPGFALLDIRARLDRSHQVPSRSCEDFKTIATPLVPNTHRFNASKKIATRRTDGYTR